LMYVTSIGRHSLSPHDWFRPGRDGVTWGGPCGARPVPDVCIPYRKTSPGRAADMLGFRAAIAAIGKVGPGLARRSRRARHTRRASSDETAPGRGPPNSRGRRAHKGRSRTAPAPPSQEDASTAGACIRRTPVAAPEDRKNRTRAKKGRRDLCPAEKGKEKKTSGRRPATRKGRVHTEGRRGDTREK